MYSHPAAEYIRILNKQHKRRIWKERAYFALFYAVNLLLMLSVGDYGTY